MVVISCLKYINFISQQICYSQAALTTCLKRNKTNVNKALPYEWWVYSLSLNLFLS